MFSLDCAPGYKVFYVLCTRSEFILNTMHYTLLCKSLFPSLQYEEHGVPTFYREVAPYGWKLCEGVLIYCISKVIAKIHRGFQHFLIFSRHCIKWLDFLNPRKTCIELIRLILIPFNLNSRPVYTVYDKQLVFQYLEEG